MLDDMLVFLAKRHVPTPERTYKLDGGWTLAMDDLRGDGGGEEMIDVNEFTLPRQLVVNYRSLTIQHDAIEVTLNSLAAEGW